MELDPSMGTPSTVGIWEAGNPLLTGPVFQQILITACEPHVWSLFDTDKLKLDTWCRVNFRVHRKQLPRSLFCTITHTSTLFPPSR